MGTTTRKMKFSIKGAAGLVTFAEEILKGTLMQI